jgi:glycosyltransferase involved in cell wall biosynthesis
VGVSPTDLSVALLTGGSDKPYAVGLASALSAQRIALDVIGSDELDCHEIRAVPRSRLLNLRGDQREDVPLPRKAARIVGYYGRLLRYAAASKPGIFHILWNNRFELIDRTLLMACYRAAGKRIVLTVHNVNVAARDGRDSWLNRMTLGVQYRLCDHLFVHTEAMKRQLVADFGVGGARITVIPFGINETIPTTTLTGRDARQRLGLGAGDRVLLFFGQIAPYKGLEYLIAALARLSGTGTSTRLVIAGKIKRGSEEYWRGVER